ncbi:MAG TPA: T9SS C-terminal target domain-containing protein [candidate division Zixibacteria bacterium]|nr:T9SS C-terminal target domain-containing protein [candidate division Zixibacteria bacterium]
MKKYLSVTLKPIFALVAILTLAVFTGCSDDDNNSSVGPDDGDESFAFLFDDMIQAGDSMNLSADSNWLVSGFVFVEEGAALSIEPGAVIRFRPGTGVNASALIIARGGRIWANGTQDNPIIFTAEVDDVNDPSDLGLFDNGLWGGLIILGSATVNTPTGLSQIEGIPSDEIRGEYGGNDDNDNSGSLRYVSIRHGGSEIGAANEINGLTLGGVGRQTVIEYVEIYSNFDDGVEFFGGVPSTRNIAVAFCGDDAFDYDEGFRGNGQFWFAVQHEKVGNRCGEHDGATGDEQGTPFAHPIISNATYIGSGNRSANSDNDYAIIMRDNAGGEYHNSIFYGFQGSGLHVEDKTGEAIEHSRARLEAGDIVFNNNIWYSFGAGNTMNDVFQQEFVRTVMAQQGWTNEMVDPLINSVARLNTGALNPVPSASGPAANAADQPAGAFFQNVSYKGAFQPGSANWLKGWTALDHYGFLQ